MCSSITGNGKSEKIITICGLSLVHVGNQDVFVLWWEGKAVGK